MRISILCITLFLSLIHLASASDIFIAPSGDDHNPGTKERPLHSLEAARDRVRMLKSENPSEGVTINLRQGEYPLSRSFTLTAQDSGSSDAPVVYRNYKKEKVVLMGGCEVTDWKPVIDPAILNRIDESARRHVLQCDLKAKGLSDYGMLTRRGFGQPTHPSHLELFFDNRPMTLARWPNGDEWAKIDAVTAGLNGGKFTYSGDRPYRWAKADDIWIHGYWTWDWADTYEHISKIDTDAHEISTTPPHGIYGYTAGKRWYALNLLEELDQPGEYYLDRGTGILYFWPPETIDSTHRAFVSFLDKPLVVLDNTSYVTLQGIDFAFGRGDGVEVLGGKKNLISSCRIKNMGNNGVVISGRENGIIGSEISLVGDAGISLNSGDRKTLTPGKDYVRNCHIHHFSRWSRTYNPGVALNGVGNIIAHCLIENAPHCAIQGGGNDNLVEYNEIHDVCLETSDSGAFYMGRDLTQRGNVIRYNYFHHIGRHQDVNAVYLDDCFCGTTIYGNVFYKGGRGVMIGGGRDNTVENNLFIGNLPAVHVDARGKGWASFWFNGKDPSLMDGLKAVNYTQPPYITHYPILAKIMDDDPAQAKGNRILRNIAVGGRWMDMYDKLTDSIVEINDNSVLTDSDASRLFEDFPKQDFRIRPDAAVWKTGFKRIPIEKIGLIRRSNPQ